MAEVVQSVYINVGICLSGKMFVEKRRLTPEGSLSSKSHGERGTGGEHSRP